MYVFGGNDSSTSSGNQLTTLHKYTFATSTWKNINYKGQSPSHCIASSSVVIGDSMWIFGGSDGKAKTDNLHEYDFGTQQFKLIQYHKQSPSPRSFHCAVVYNDSMYIFGGLDENNKSLNEVWSFSIKAVQNTTSIPISSIKQQLPH